MVYFSGCQGVEEQEFSARRKEKRLGEAPNSRTTVTVIVAQCEVLYFLHLGNTKSNATIISMSGTLFWLK